MNKKLDEVLAAIAVANELRPSALLAHIRASMEQAVQSPEQENPER